MKLLETLSKIFAAPFEERHHIMNPESDVREKLEQQGYRFEFNVHSCVAYPMYGMNSMAIDYGVVTPEGERFSTFHKSSAAQETITKYKDAYDKAKLDCAPRP